MKIDEKHKNGNKEIRQHITMVQERKSQLGLGSRSEEK